jgi:endonuclease YncB( thermonuclease family)
LERCEEGGNISARIFHPAGDIAYEVLKNGYAKLNQPKNIDFDAEYYKTLKEAQLIAQSKNLKIWKDLKPQEEKKQQKPSTTDFAGRVVEIHSGDSLTIERESDFALIRVYLTTVKAPQLMKKPGEDPDPYAWESKEELRKLTIGKKVRVVMEFSKTVKVGGEGGTEKNMDFATVFLEKNDKSVAVTLLERGLLKTNVTKSGDNASKFLEDLLGAEKKAVEAKLGLFSP